MGRSGEQTHLEGKAPNLEKEHEQNESHDFPSGGNFP
jgi:hypothetical protein